MELNFKNKTMNIRTRALKNNLNPDLWEHRTEKELDIFLGWKMNQHMWLAKKVEKMDEEMRAVYEDNEFDEDYGVGFIKTGSIIMSIIIVFVVLVIYKLFN